MKKTDVLRSARKLQETWAAEGFSKYAKEFGEKMINDKVLAEVLKDIERVSYKDADDAFIKITDLAARFYGHTTEDETKTT